MEAIENLWFPLSRNIGKIVLIFDVSRARECGIFPHTHSYSWIINLCYVIKLKWRNLIDKRIRTRHRSIASHGINNVIVMFKFINFLMRTRATKIEYYQCVRCVEKFIKSLVCEFASKLYTETFIGGGEVGTQLQQRLHRVHVWRGTLFVSALCV